MKKIAIKLQNYYHECADGCCTDFGTRIKVNGEELYQDGYLTENALFAVLTHLGYDVVVEEIDENGEVISQLGGNK